MLEVIESLDIVLVGIAICVFFERMRSSIVQLRTTLERLEEKNSAEHSKLLDTFAEVKKQMSEEHKEMLLLINEIKAPLIEINTKLDLHLDTRRRS